MISYPDGTEAQVGDSVVLAHGDHNGTVLHVIESPADIELWGLEEPGLMIDTSFGGYVFYPMECLSSDDSGEIAFVSRGNSK